MHGLGWQLPSLWSGHSIRIETLRAGTRVIIYIQILLEHGFHILLLELLNGLFFFSILPLYIPKYFPEELSLCFSYFMLKVTICYQILKMFCHFKKHAFSCQFHECGSFMGFQSWTWWRHCQMLTILDSNAAMIQLLICLLSNPSILWFQMFTRGIF